MTHYHDKKPLMVLFSLQRIGIIINFYKPKEKSSYEKCMMLQNDLVFWKFVSVSQRNGNNVYEYQNQPTLKMWGNFTEKRFIQCI